uniref:Uncharacterized protein n=1 Tax=Setaria viridis TaxID=4556 RepID=A0A4U6T3E3_SETVI|nr:hypothetical protein SEVIR_9G408650v2 [Setaria viridis]
MSAEISLIQSVVKLRSMADDEARRYLIEQIIAGDSSSNLSIAYTDEKGSQADMFLNLSVDGNEEPEPQQNVTVAEGSYEPSGLTNRRPKPRGPSKVNTGTKKLSSRNSKKRASRLLPKKWQHSTWVRSGQS